MSSTSFVIEENLRNFRNFVTYALIEWIVIFLLFVQGLLGILCNRFARLFHLKLPCLLCTRIDLLHNNDPYCYYNDSVCDDHKKGISSLAYCNLHKKLSDINAMCQRCLVSFNSNNKFNNLQDDNLHFSNADDGRKFLMNPPKKEDTAEIAPVDKTAPGVLHCSCCGDAVKSKSPAKFKRMLSMSAPSMSPRPRANLDFAAARFMELKLVADRKLDTPGDVEDIPISDYAGRGDARSAADYMMGDYSSRTPSTRTNKFFGIPLSDSATMSTSPRWACNGKSSSSSSSRKLSLDGLDSNMIEASERDDDLMARLKQQIRADREVMMELQTELDEERSASATAANNAMAMISRLQAEKAAVQMEALQYQRMTEEQAEYDEEELQMMKDLLYKKDEEIKALESELEMYRGPIEREYINTANEITVSPKSDFDDDFDDDY